MYLDKADNLELNKKEIYRYLGYSKIDAESIVEEKLEEMIDECIDDIRRVSELRSVCLRFPLCTDEDGETLYIGDAEIKSKDLSKNLKGCSEVFIFGATIGIGTDRLIAKAKITNMTKAAVYQAVGAEFIEAYCNIINRNVKEKVALEGKVTAPRFSPGYGDFNINYQEKIFEMLNLTKHAGISLTDNMIMVPSKSVTAVIGVKEANR